MILFHVILNEVKDLFYCPENKADSSLRSE